MSPFAAQGWGETGDRQDCQRISGKLRRKSMAVLSVPGGTYASIFDEGSTCCTLEAHGHCHAECVVDQVYYQEQAGERVPRVSPRRHHQGARQDQGRRERAPSGFRRRVDCPQRHGHGREHHCPQGQFRPGRGANLPDTRQGGGSHRCGSHGPCAPRQALLSARLEGQSRPSERARIVSASACVRPRAPANSAVKRRWNENCARAASTRWPVWTKSAAAPCSARSSPAPSSSPKIGPCVVSTTANCSNPSAAKCWPNAFASAPWRGPSAPWMRPPSTASISTRPLEWPCDWRSTA